MPRITRATLRQIMRFGNPRREGPGDPITRRTLYPLSVSDTGDGGAIVVGRIFQSWTAIPQTSTPTFTTNVVQVNTGTGPNAVGTVSQHLDSTNGFYYNNYISGTTVGNAAGWAGVVGGGAQSGFINPPDLLPDVVFIVKTGAAAGDLTGVRIWTVLYAAAGILNGDTFPTTGVTNSAVGFRFSTPAGDSNWKTVSGDGTTGNTVNDSGVAVVGDTRYVFRIKFPTPTSVEFYINGVLVQTHTTTLPPNNQFLLPESHIVNNTGGVGSGKNWRIRQIFSLAN